MKKIPGTSTYEEALNTYSVAFGYWNSANSSIKVAKRILRALESRTIVDKEGCFSPRSKSDIYVLLNSPSSANSA